MTAISRWIRWDRPPVMVVVVSARYARVEGTQTRGRLLKCSNDTAAKDVLGMWKEVRSDDCNQKFRYCIGGSVDRWIGGSGSCDVIHSIFLFRVWQADGCVAACCVVRVSSSAHA